RPVGEFHRHAANVVVAAVGIAGDDTRSVVGNHAEPAAGTTAVHRGQVGIATLGGDSVEYRAEELHEGCLARLVEPVENGDLGGEAAKLEVVPNAEAVDGEIGDSHVRFAGDGVGRGAKGREG